MKPKPTFFDVYIVFLFNKFSESCMETIAQIDKEFINKLSFSKQDVLDTEAARKKRSFDLMRAQALGNLLHTKVSIHFADAEQKHYKVNTTVWAVGTDFINLKGNAFIPIRSILEID